MLRLNRSIPIICIVSSFYPLLMIILLVATLNRKINWCNQKVNLLINTGK